MTTGVNHTTVIAFAASAGVAALLVALVAGPLEDADPSTARIRARLMAVDPPQLWRAAVIGPLGQATATTYICADTPLAQTFGRGLAEVNGEACRVTNLAVLKPDVFSARCEVYGRRFAVSTATTGDRTRAFRMEFMLAPLDSPDPPVRQSIGYQRLGACPNGWTIGEQRRAPR